MKSILKKKWLGLPIITIIAALVIGLVAGGVVADWHYTQTLQNSTVTISGSGLMLYKDAGATTAYSYPNDTLPSFGKINTDIGSAPFASGAVTLYLKNTGTTNLSPTIAMTSTGSTSGLTLNEATAGTLSSSPVALLGLGTPLLPFIASSYTSLMAGNCGTTGITDLLTKSSINAVVPQTGYLETGSEIWHYTGWDVSGSGCVVHCDARGVLGTTPITYTDGTVITFGLMTMPSVTLSHGQVQTITLKVLDDGTATLGENPTFGIIIDANPGS